MINLNYRDSRPIYEQIKEGFIKLITTGVMAEDEKMPSVRELAGRLAINPNTIQKAYAQLEQEGYIYTVAGRGSFVTADVDATERRKSRMMEDLKKLISEIKELAVDKTEIMDVIDSVYKEREKGAKDD